MTQTEIKAETEFLINFLDLPESRSLINNLRLMSRQKFSLCFVSHVWTSHNDRSLPYFSGGQQRRTSLAVAMLHKPDLLILDEPTVGVDPLIRERYRIRTRISIYPIITM